MATTTVENYIKTLFTLQQATPEGSRVPMGRLAEAMGVVPGTATTMMKTLHDAELVDYESRGGVLLTPNGTTLALHVLRRHRLLELFLVEIVGLDWSQVHEEAEHLEHAVSERLINRIDELLNFPEVDPHGDPIPDINGHMRTTPLQRLSDLDIHASAVVARVSDQDSPFLRFLEENQIKPGRRVRIQSRNEPADAITIAVEDGPEMTVGTRTAEKIYVH